MKKDEKNEEAKKSSRKSIGTMNVILIIVGVFLVAFTLKMISLFEVYGMVPDTLINCVFVALAGECGIMGWIKTSKEKNKDRRWQLEDRKRERENLLEDQNNSGGDNFPLG
jgi:flagellar basal body-associated protein FliL